jgi:hypothetical protein
MRRRPAAEAHRLALALPEEVTKASAPGRAQTRLSAYNAFRFSVAGCGWLGSARRRLGNAADTVGLLTSSSSWRPGPSTRCRSTSRRSCGRGDRAVRQRGQVAHWGKYPCLSTHEGDSATVKSSISPVSLTAIEWRPRRVLGPNLATRSSSAAVCHAVIARDGRLTSSEVVRADDHNGVLAHHHRLGSGPGRPGRSDPRWRT